MPTVNLSLLFNGWQGFTPGGVPLSGGFLYTYQAGTSTPQATYTDAGGSVPNSNPIVLGADGRPPSEIWLIQGSGYQFVLKDSLGNLIASYDNITGAEIGGTAASLLTAYSSKADLASTSDALKGAALEGYNPALAYASGMGQFLNNVYARNAAEISAGVTPTNYYYAPFDVRRYGVVGDGATDDTAAFQAAINLVSNSSLAHGQGKLTIPNGCAIMITSPIYIYGNTQIQGSGNNFSSQISIPSTWSNATPAINIDGSTVTGGFSPRVELSGFAIVCDASIPKANVNSLIYINEAYNFVLDNLLFSTARAVAIKVAGADSVGEINHCQIRSDSTSNLDKGIHITAGEVSMVYPDIEVALVGLQIDGGSVTIHSGHLERNNTGIKHTDGNLTMLGGKVWGVNAGTVCVNVARTSGDPKFVANQVEVVPSGGAGWYMDDSSSKPDTAVLRNCVGSVTDTKGWFVIDSAGDNSWFPTTLRRAKSCNAATATTFYTVTLPTAGSVVASMTMGVYATLGGQSVWAGSYRVVAVGASGSVQISAVTEFGKANTDAAPANYTLSIAVTATVSGGAVSLKVTCTVGGALGAGSATTVQTELVMVQQAAGSSSVQAVIV